MAGSLRVRAYRSWGAVGALVALSLGGAVAWWFGRPPEPMVMLGGPRGGTYDSVARRVELLTDLPIEFQSDGEGSIRNLELLAEGKSALGIVSGQVLQQELQQRPQQGLSIVGRLDTDFVQTVVRKDVEPPVLSLCDMVERWGPDKKVFLGNPRTGNRSVVDAALRTLEHPQRFVEPEQASESLAGAAEQLMKGEIDGAVFVTAIPSPLVVTLVADGRFRLIAFERGRHCASELADTPAPAVSAADRRPPVLSLASIPGETYPGLSGPVRTAVSPAYLVGRDEATDANDVERLVETGLDNSHALHVQHSWKELLRPWDAFEIPAGVPLGLHAGSMRVKRKLRTKLLILTGAFGGKYHAIGRSLRRELATRDVTAYVSHSDGSLENAERLRAWSESRDTHQHMVAIMQADAALVSVSGTPMDAYGLQLLPVDVDKEAALRAKNSVAAVKGLRWLASLHSERMHLLLNRRFVELELKSGAAGAGDGTLDDPLEHLRDRRIAVGAPNSGSQLTARAILANYYSWKQRAEGRNGWPTLVSMPVNEMLGVVEQGHTVVAGMFAAYTPSALIQRALLRDVVRLHPIQLRSDVPGLSRSTIDKGTYRNQPDIHTLETHAIVVTTRDLPDDMAEEVVSSLDAILAQELPELTRKGLAKEHPLIATHPGAVSYYTAEGLLPGTTWEERFSYLKVYVPLGIALFGVIGAIRRYLFELSLGARVRSAINSPPNAGAIATLRACDAQITRRAGHIPLHPNGMTSHRWSVWHTLIRHREEEIQAHHATHFYRVANRPDSNRKALRSEMDCALEAGTLSPADHARIASLLDAPYASIGESGRAPAGAAADPGAGSSPRSRGTRAG